MKHCTSRPTSSTGFAEVPREPPWISAPTEGWAGLPRSRVSADGPCARVLPLPVLAVLPRPLPLPVPMADAFAHASGMAQSHASHSVSGREEAARYIKAQPKPAYEVLYPPRSRVLLHREQKMHVAGGVHRVDYALVEDSASRVLVASPYDTSQRRPLRAIFLSLPRLYEALDALDEKPWTRHAGAEARDRTVCKFVVGRRARNGTVQDDFNITCIRAGST